MENAGKCELYAEEIKQLDKRVSALEEHREKDKHQVYELDKSLSVFINEMKNISEELKTIANNAKEAVVRSTTAHDKEIALLKDKVVEQEKKIEKLDVKLTQETIGANSEKYKKITGYIATFIIGAILSFVLVAIGLK